MIEGKLSKIAVRAADQMAVYGLRLTYNSNGREEIEEWSGDTSRIWKE